MGLLPRVLVTVPNEHWIHRQVVATVVRLLLHDRRYQLDFRMPAAKPYENNQHHIIREFLHEGFDFWLSMDSDNPPIGNPLDLVALNLDVVGLPTPVWHWKGGARERPIYWNAYRYDPAVDAYREHLPREGLQRVDAIGTGCFLIARRVFEHPAMQRGAFTRKLLPDGVVDRGNDFSFSERAREAGFTLWCHYDYPCRHFNELDLHDVALAIKGLSPLAEPCCDDHHGFPCTSGCAYHNTGSARCLELRELQKTGMYYSPSDDGHLVQA